MSLVSACGLEVFPDVVPEVIGVSEGHNYHNISAAEASAGLKFFWYTWKTLENLYPRKLFAFIVFGLLAAWQVSSQRMTLQNLPSRQSACIARSILCIMTAL